MGRGESSLKIEWQRSSDFKCERHQVIFMRETKIQENIYFFFLYWVIYHSIGNYGMFSLSSFLGYISFSSLSHKSRKETLSRELDLNNDSLDLLCKFSLILSGNALS
jgi:hypothetical protein